mmetsp:Transcript_26993/g.90354  ORF Transcript_26993/g.90354 Transcript_26993/m.90354 type:complete len:111 (+) Transcript_26993:378-710(+)
MPSDPETMYADEWQGWDDWLGRPLPYRDAKTVVSTLGILTQQDWWRAVKERAECLQDLRVPSRPHIYYKEWAGYDDWLGLEPTMLFAPKPDDDEDDEETDWEDQYPGATG